MTQENPYNATLVERCDIHDALAVFKVRYDSGDAPDFEPGQYTTLGLIDPDAPPPNPKSPRSRRKGPRLVRRAYSIASPPGEKSHLSFYVVCIDDGRYTQLLWDLKPGDPLFMDEKIKGTFTLEDIPADKDLILVATGTGLGPYMSMIHTYRGKNQWRRLVVIEGCRYVPDLGYHDALMKIADEDDAITYLPTVTREAAGSQWPGRRGRVQGILEPSQFEKLTGFPLDPEQCHVMLCGNPEMIEETSTQLNKLGFITQDRDHPEGNVHFERYW